MALWGPQSSMALAACALHPATLHHYSIPSQQLEGSNLPRTTHLELPILLARQHILGTGLQGSFQDVILPAPHEDDSLAGKREEHGAGVRHLAARLGHRRPDGGSGAVGVVGEGLDDVPRAARTIALIHHLPEGMKWVGEDT